MTGNETCSIGINLSIFSYAQVCFVNPLEVFFFLFSFAKLAIVKVAPSNRYFCFVLRYSTPVMTLISVVLSSSFSYVDQIITFECDVVLYKESSPSFFKFALVFVFGISVCFHKGNSVNSTMTSYSLVVLLILELLSFSLGSQQLSEHSFKLSSEETDSLRVVTQPVGKGTRWAVLIAGSNGYENYRHQADVCHAYQILRKGGLKDENIIVFMYDDIAFSEYNPRPGIIINRPQGEDVYEGVPKDYTGRNASINNLFAVILANKTALTGGSGKVLDTGSEDHIFIYYTDHGSPGMVGMPADEILYASDLIDVLKKKHDSNTFKSMVFYLEACDSGSMFEGLLPEGLNIYATTASNSAENSFATYCPDDNPDVESYGTCLGDLYSVSWMEDSDHNDLRKETLDQQYEVVQRRTANGNKVDSSHVMKYGNTKLGKNSLYSYFGSSPANDNYTFITHDSSTISKAASQRDAELLHFWHKFHRAPRGSKKKLTAEKQLRDEINHRVHIDESMMSIAKILFRSEKGLMMLETVRPAGQPLVDDWNCFKAFVRTYEEHCGLLSRYGRRYARAIANMCNAGVKVEQMAMASATACHA